MKKAYTLILSLLCLLPASGHGQNGFPYQAVLRDATGATLNQSETRIRFSLYQGTDNTPVYREVHSTTTGAAGEIALTIGAGDPVVGDFGQINWSITPAYISIEADFGTSAYRLLGRQELLSVPYARHTEQAGALQTLTKDKTNYRLTATDKGDLQVVEIPEGYTRLVFQDEFNGEGLVDDDKWVYEVGFVRNHEMQYYTEKRIENVYQKDGVLHIRCINQDTLRDESGNILNKYIDPKTGKDYYITSGSINTKGKYDWTYCRVEARLKVPLGSGTWSAIWMMPAKSVYGYWPRSGEIDIMEYVGNDANKFNCATHFLNGDRGGNKVIDNVDDWHIIALEWHEDRLEWYCDGRLFYRTKNPETDWGDWPFDIPFYFMLNYAYGGGWGGRDGYDVSILPNEYLIDYVRIYQ